jgi:hypothetical protein
MSWDILVQASKRIAEIDRITSPVGVKIGAASAEACRILAKESACAWVVVSGSVVESRRTAFPSISSTQKGPATSYKAPHLRM